MTWNFSSINWITFWKNYSTSIHVQIRVNEGKKKSYCKKKTKFCIDFFLQSWFFLFTKKSTFMRFSDSCESRKIHKQRPEHPNRWETRDDASCSNALLSETEYSLLLVSRGEVLGARRCSVARIAAVQGVLREETAIVLVHSTRPKSRALCELYPGTVLRLELGLHGRRRPLQISSHIACCRSFCCCGLGLVHRCWCLRDRRLRTEDDSGGWCLERRRGGCIITG